MANPPRILALDLAMRLTGVACPDGTTRTWDRSALSQPKRLTAMYDGLRNAVDVLRPDLVVIEEYAFSARGAHSHEVGEIGGVARLALLHSEQPWMVVKAQTIKTQATGKGNASKDEVLVAAVRRLGYAGSSKDEADALWARTAVLDALGWAETEFPVAHRRAHAKIVWPSAAFVRRWRNPAATIPRP